MTVLKKCDAYYGQSIKMKMDFMDKGIDSDIFKSKDDYNFIIENISKRVNRKIREIKQIFKASSNGDNINAFHDCCTYVQNMFVLILTDEKKCFGGFSRAEWNNNNKYKSDDTAFIEEFISGSICISDTKYDRYDIWSHNWCDTYRDRSACWNYERRKK